MTHNKKSNIFILYALPLMLLLNSCGSGKLNVSSVGYQSVRTTYAQPESIPADAKIAVEYFINSSGQLLGIIFNLTDDVMMIDQTKSFLVNTNGMSISYYDPTVVTNTTSSFNSQTDGASFNLGALASAFGIGGPLGALMGGTTIGGSSTTGTSTSQSVQKFDLPMVNIGPKGRVALSKQYAVDGVGRNNLSIPMKYIDATSKTSPLKFSVCITYSVDNGATFDKLVTDFYVNSSIVEQVNNGRVNEAFMKIYEQKSDALAENYYIFSVNDNLSSTSYEDDFDSFNCGGIYNLYIKGSLIDFK